MYYKRDDLGIGVILEEKLVQIGLIIAEILLFMECDRDLHFQGSDAFVVSFSSCTFNESLIKIGCIIAEI